MDEEPDPPSAGRFAAALFAIAVAAAVAFEFAAAWLLGSPASVRGGLETGVLIGGIFAVIYYVGSVLTERWFADEDDPGLNA